MDCSQLNQSLPCRTSVWPQFTWVVTLQPDCARAETANDVREKLQTGLPREAFFEKSTMPNHKLAGLWTDSQGHRPFQASFALPAHSSGMK